jgi:hypothetical protein
MAILKGLVPFQGDKKWKTKETNNPTNKQIQANPRTGGLKMANF